MRYGIAVSSVLLKYPTMRATSHVPSEDVSSSCLPSKLRASGYEEHTGALPDTQTQQRGGTDRDE